MTPTVAMWNFKRIEDCSRDELIEALNWSSNRITELENQRRRTHDFVDWAAFLTKKAAA